MPHQYSSVSWLFLSVGVMVLTDTTADEAEHEVGIAGDLGRDLEFCIVEG